MLYELNVWASKYLLPGRNVMARCEEKLHVLEHFMQHSTPQIKNSSLEICRELQGTVGEHLIPSFQKAVGSTSGQLRQQLTRELNTLIQGSEMMKSELALSDPSRFTCLKILKYVATKANGIKFTFSSTVTNNINYIVNLLQPVASSFAPIPPTDPQDRLLWVQGALVNMSNQATWHNYTDIECNNEWQQTAGMRAIIFALLQIGTILTCKGVVNRVLTNRLSIPISPININNVLTEEDARAALKVLGENRIPLKAAADKNKNTMLWFSFLTLPLLIFFFLGPKIFQSSIIAFMLSILSFTGREGAHRLQDYRRKNRWEAHRSQLIDQLDIALASLNVTVTPQHEDNPEACYFLLEVKKNNTLQLTRDEQRQVLMRVLRQYKIDTTRMGGRYIIAISGQTILANALAINQTLLNEIERQQLLAKLEEQLKRLAPLLNLQIIPVDDAAGLPTFRCSMLTTECPANIEALFPQNEFSKEDNGKILIMQGFTPGNELSLKKFLLQLQAKDSALRERFDASVNTGNTTHTPLRQRPRPSQAPIEPVLPLQAPEERIVIRWNSGKTFNSVEAKEPDYRQAGAVIPVASDFFPANRYFCIFEISPHEVNNDAIYNKFLEQAQYPRTARLQGEQGILFWNEARSFNKFTYDFRGQLARRERVDYIAAAKLKIKGDGGDARCYGWSEVAPTGQTLIHFIEYDPETH
ncbi:MAG: hypothetical protein K5Q00_02830 [Gammaproteobacteria bacterium]|nr:hypothetical protein [Gammaproteobacteria bacterium]